MAADLTEGPGPEVLAAIDIGTNSVHMVVARVHESGGFEILGREKEQVRLGTSGGDMKELSDEAIDRAIAALERFRQIADISGATIRAVATSAVREAQNRNTFIERARTEAGIDVDVISGFEEARLIHLGALQSVPLIDRQIMLMDIGGGSTELVIGLGHEALLVKSLKLGAVRLTNRFLSDAVTTPKAIGKCRTHIRSSLEPFVRKGRKLGFETAVGCSGTIEALARLIEIDRGSDAAQTLNNFVFTTSEMRVVVDRLSEATTVEERRAIPGVDEKRADILLAGGLIAIETLEAMDVVEMTVSESALREGVLLDTLHRRTGAAMHHLEDLRRRSVTHLGELMDEDRAHSCAVRDLALTIFDETASVHGLGDAPRELLEAAALLANVGLFVSHAGHHKHSYYVIRNSEHLTGFTDREIEVIAQVARYHRKSEPKRKHPEFAALSPADQHIVAVLAGVLRVAIALDRTHQGVVKNLSADVTKKAITFAVSADSDLTLELFTADQRKGLLETTLGRSVEITAT